MSEFLIYQAEDGKAQLSVLLDNEDLWLSQKQLTELFGKAKGTISEHIKHIFEDGELHEASVVRFYRTTAADGKSYEVAHYNLEMVLALGFRVRSQAGVRFRQWANAQLKEFIVKGFVLDDERLKNPPVAGSVVPDYFAQLLERVRDIRASERRMYLRVREIFAMAADYEPSLPETTTFFRIIQNKLHFAVTGKTAAEIIRDRVDAAQPNMGLATWKGQWLTKADVTVAKNYLTETEISELNRIVVMWLDFAEDQALRRKQVFLSDWTAKLDAFLQFNDRQVLSDAGKVTKKQADAKALAEYEKFAEQRRAMLEQQGEADAMNALINVSKALLSNDMPPSTTQRKKNP
ncbi:virulence RhuM family protein [Comamonas sp. 26]|uniref:virulence RhuM family protein n=1 Tax=Comamonas sp. 26 TaxID=2035201 RepID=UPI000C19AA4A|nr:virulence RhuM family protein [Comamonas sp. 26]PIG08307.1 hypothetical protein CLU84_1152 [Comamonas sp. 26]